jgi:hypothetical protein
MLIFLQSWCKAHHWEDGSLVREVKLVLWLKEDVLLHRHQPRKTKRKRGGSSAKPLGKLEADEAKTAAFLAQEALDLAQEIGQPVEEALAMLIDDRIALPRAEEDEVEHLEGALYRHSTIEVYITAVMELY